MVFLFSLLDCCALIFLSVYFVSLVEEGRDHGSFPGLPPGQWAKGGPGGRWQVWGEGAAARARVPSGGVALCLWPACLLSACPGPPGSPRERSLSGRSLRAVGSAAFSGPRQHPCPFVLVGVCASGDSPHPGDDSFQEPAMCFLHVQFFREFLKGVMAEASTECFALPSAVEDL